jgi:hypothetical protein
VVDLSLLVGAPVLAIGVSLVAYAPALRSRYHYTSALTCPKCDRQFEYGWVPGASFGALRLGRGRYLKCPLCKGWSTFDVVDTRVDSLRPPGQPQPFSSPTASPMTNVSDEYGRYPDTLSA